MAEAHSTTLRFAATHALSFTFMPGWLRGLESRTTVGPVTLVSDVLARCEAMLLQSQVQFVLSHAHAQSSSELLSQDYPFVCVGSDMLIPVSAPDLGGRPASPSNGCDGQARCRSLSYSPESGIGRILREVRGATLERWPCAECLQGAPCVGVAHHGTGRPRDGVAASNADRGGS